DSMSSFRLYLWLMVAFAALALVLALTGTYGVMAYVVASRAREFAIRLALGARRSTIILMVLRQTFVLTVFGLGIGIGLTVLASPLLRSLPVSISAPGVGIIAPVVALVGVCALAASAIPARRASSVDAMVLLRNE